MFGSQSCLHIVKYNDFANFIAYFVQKVCVTLSVCWSWKAYRHFHFLNATISYLNEMTVNYVGFSIKSSFKVKKQIKLFTSENVYGRTGSNNSWLPWVPSRYAYPYPPLPLKLMWKSDEVFVAQPWHFLGIALLVVLNIDLRLPSSQPHSFVWGGSLDWFWILAIFLINIILHVSQTLPVAIASVRNVHSQCPREVLQFILDLIKYNDNRLNKVK